MKRIKAIGLLFALLVIFSTSAFAQKKDSVVVKDSLHLQTKTTGEWHRPLALFSGATATITTDARQYYGSPMTVAQIMEEAGIGLPLLLRDQSYGRETFLMTNRSGEPLVSMSLDGILPLNDPVTGTALLNYFPLENFAAIRVSANGAMNYNDLSSSDAVELTPERLRAPIPYSRLHYSQELSNSLSNFEGLFSYNPSQPVNLTFGIYHRAAGKSRNQIVDINTFNPRVDNWSLLSQTTYESPKIEATLWMLYTTAFSGVNGGVVAKDTTTDIFDERLAQTATANSYDHRTRFDALGEMSLPLLSEKEQTKLAGFATIAARRIFANDSAFALYANPLSTADRLGIALIQPLGFDLGSFQTRALLRGDLQYLTKKTGCDCADLSETRISGYGSDSLSIGGDFGISLAGYLRATLSRLSVGGTKVPEQFFTNFGVDASMKLTSALQLTGLVNYARDRATLSPTPTETYEIKNLGGFLNLNVGLGKHDSLSARIGVLDRREPEGVVIPPTDSTEIARPYFSALEVHTSSISGRFDLWLNKFRFSANANYFPSFTPLSRYTNTDALRADLASRINGSFGVYYENEIAEGNLRLSLGGRVRYINHLSPTIGYDGASDYYVYRGIESFGTLPLHDDRLATSKFLFDVLVSAEIDRRAQLSVKLLNILSQNYYTVSLYPRSGLQFVLDVSWAFLD